MRMTKYKTYEEAVEHFMFSQAWRLFDDHQEKFNIAHECIDRHVGTGTTTRVKFDDGRIEQFTFEKISRLSLFC